MLKPGCSFTTGNPLPRQICCQLLSPSSAHVGRRQNSVGLLPGDEVQHAQRLAVTAAAAAANEEGGGERETRTPHSGYHFDGSSRRFFEGWYFKITIPKQRLSFAWMYSIEDPKATSGSSTSPNPLSIFSNPLTLLPPPPVPSFSPSLYPGVGAQIMGPNDSYLCQYSTDTSIFWASPHELCLGAVFDQSEPGSSSSKGGSRGIWKGNQQQTIPAKDFSERVEEGFQVSPTWHQGSLRSGGITPHLPATIPSAAWSYSTRPLYGWGDVNAEQKSTAGWLAALPVFEPHWQICMAAGVASGWVQWGEQRFEFDDALAYVEKNWGGSFPLKWFWVQCNAFDGTNGETALTAGGGRRGLPLLPGVTEDIAMIGVHHRGKFFEFVPWKEGAEVEWRVEPWGRWEMRAKTEEFEVELVATTEEPGVVLRAPSADAGLAPMCRDTFDGKLLLEMWRREGGKRGDKLLSASSSLAALEVGGGPWWSTWEKKTNLSYFQRAMLGLPIDVGALVPQVLRPPGL